MATIPENQLEISSSIGTSGYVRVVGTDGKSYRVAIRTLVADAGLGDLSDLTTTATTDLVSAINELDARTMSVSGTVLVIE